MRVLAFRSEAEAGEEELASAYQPSPEVATTALSGKLLRERSPPSSGDQAWHRRTILVDQLAEACGPLGCQHRHEDAARSALGDRNALVEPLLCLDDDDAGKDRPEPPAGALQQIVQPQHEATARRREEQRIGPGCRREVRFPEQFGQLAA